MTAYADPFAMVYNSFRIEEAHARADQAKAGCTADHSKGLTAMTTPTDDQLAAAAQKARADHETAREIAARLLAPPDPVDQIKAVP